MPSWGSASSQLSPCRSYGRVLLSPRWFAGMALLRVARSQQRGRMRGAILAWIVAVGGLPGVAALIPVALWA